MVNRDELLDIYSEDGEVIKRVSRSEAEDANHITSNVIVFILNPLNQVLIQLRPKTKKHYPGLWDVSTCGGVESGENIEEAATRELQEETGIAGVDLEYIKTFMNVFPSEDGKEDRKRLSHIYVAITNKSPLIQSDEVDELRFVPYKELAEDCKLNPSKYIPPFRTELNIVLDFLKLQ